MQWTIVQLSPKPRMNESRSSINICGRRAIVAMTLCVMICQTSSCYICLQRLGFASICSHRPVLASLEQYWRDNWFVEFNICRETRWLCFSVVLLPLSWPIELALVWSFLPLMIFRHRPVWIPSVWKLNWSTSPSTLPLINWLVDGLGLMVLMRSLPFTEVISWRIQQMFSPAFQWFVVVILRCRP